MNFAIILAGGTGTRAGGPLPKQFQRIGGKMMLRWSVEAFRGFDKDCGIVVVMHPDYLPMWDDMCGEMDTEVGPIIKASGGKTRIGSVRNGLKAIEENLRESNQATDFGDVKVFIHDAARPFVTKEMMARGEKVARPGVGAVPAIPLTDSIRMLAGKHSEARQRSKAVDRSGYVAVQTPQIFMLDDILRAYNLLEDERGLTDDASVAEKFNIQIDIFEGDPANRKITNPSDFGH